MNFRSLLFAAVLAVPALPLAAEEEKKPSSDGLVARLSTLAAKNGIYQSGSALAGAKLVITTPKPDPQPKTQPLHVCIDPRGRIAVNLPVAREVLSPAAFAVRADIYRQAARAADAKPVMRLHVLPDSNEAAIETVLATAGENRIRIIQFYLVNKAERSKFFPADRPIPRVVVPPPAAPPLPPRPK